MTRQGGRPWRRLRAQVLAEEMYCHYKLPGCTAIATTVDHIIPVSKGGAELDRANLVGACRQCNRTKSDTLPDKLRQEPEPEHWMLDVKGRRFPVSQCWRPEGCDRHRGAA